MRFNKLSLERYGRFKDCELEFPAREVDLQIVLGANEAGKTTAMAAISDLLFGFQARSPYNFMFDYSLLRVGATLEEDGSTLVCRRRKAATGSLVDGDDRPITEVPLLSMLRGQTRDSFHTGFSLDQTRLRAGGRLIVSAKDDVGQAVFGAGSGMTGISQVVKELEEEADAMWGPRASARRTYSVAKSQFDEANQRLRNAELRPKTWTDARQLRDDRQVELDALETERSGKTEQRASVERLRRVGPHLLLRADLRGKLQTSADVVVLTPQAEQLAEAAIAASEVAARERSKATELLDDVKKRIHDTSSDPDILALAEKIDELGDDRGAVAKGKHDLTSREAELAAARERIREIRRDLGSYEGKPPARLMLSRLRSLARQWGEQNARRQTLADALASTDQSIANVTDRIPESDSSSKLEALAPAVATARELGKDFDQRVVDLSRKAERAEAEADSALKRLAPWSGSFDNLAELPLIAEEEITAAQAKVQRSVDAMDDEVSEIRRIKEDLARTELRREGLEKSGKAVSVEALNGARSERNSLWGTIRAHVIGEGQLSNPAQSAAAFEHSVTEADAVADSRFNFAQASAQLVDLDSAIAELQLREQQAKARHAAAERDRDAASEDWLARLNEAALPALAPEPFLSWARARTEALERHDAAAAYRLEADRLQTQRDGARDAIVVLPFLSAQAGSSLRDALSTAEAALTGLEEEMRAIETDRAELGRLTKQREADQRNLGSVEERIGQIDEEWDGAQADAGVALGIRDADTGLDLFEDLAAAEESASNLERRIAGIRADETSFQKAVANIAELLKLEPNKDAMILFDTLRQRLAGGREKANALGKLEDERDRREAELRDATADWNAAVSSVSTIIEQCRLGDFSEVGAAIHASRSTRELNDELEATERQITTAGDGESIEALEAAWAETSPDELSRRSEDLENAIADLNQQVTEAANAVGEARREFEALEHGSAASDAAADAAQARAEMDVVAEAYLLKRSEAFLLKWSMEKYREQRQDPLLNRASALFSKLTLGRYAELRVDFEAPSPRLLGMCDDRATLVDIDSMSEGTTDQLFLALRLAAVEQSIEAGIRVPFLADDLFVNFDNERSAAGFEVLAELAQSTQVLFFTHHEHLSKIASSVIKQPEIPLCVLR